MPAEAQKHRVREDRQWFIVGRWQEYEGKGRANLLRIAGIGSVLSIELVNYYTGVVDRPFHQAATALALSWAMVALGVLFCLAEHFFPASLKFLSTAADVFLLTAILILGDGPKSPLVVAYFLLIVLATLRFNLRLIWFASIGSMLSYIFLLGYARWFTERDLRIAQLQPSHLPAGVGPDRDLARAGDSPRTGNSLGVRHPSRGDGRANVRGVTNAFTTICPSQSLPAMRGGHSPGREEVLALPGKATTWLTR